MLPKTGSFQEKAQSYFSAVKSHFVFIHGQPMKGNELKRHLELLTHDFKEIAVPEQRRFVEELQTSINFFDTIGITRG